MPHMDSFPLYPLWIFDLLGSAAMIILAGLCLRVAFTIFHRDQENPLANYLLWFIGAIFAFSLSRSLGHIVKYILIITDHQDLWDHLAPVSGSINSITFVVIASVTLFFQRIQTIMERMKRDRLKIEKTSHDLLELNKDLENIVFERTRAEMALRTAHEVRNPVVIISGLIQRLVSTSAICSDEKEKLELILHQAKKLESLVAKFEDVRPEAKRTFAPLELNSLVEASINVIQEEADNKGVTILLDRAPSSLVFQGNEQLLKIAILHVLRNAIEACGLGDTIQISTELGPQGILLQIQDNGSGIPQEILIHIFEPFYSTRKGGTGLGLPYVKQIIEEHKGHIEIASAEQVGTTVSISLPTHLGVLSKAAPPDYQI